MYWNRCNQPPDPQDCYRMNYQQCFVGCKHDNVIMTLTRVGLKGGSSRRFKTSSQLTCLKNRWFWNRRIIIIIFWQIWFGGKFYSIHKGQSLKVLLQILPMLSVSSFFFGYVVDDTIITIHWTLGHDNISQNDQGTVFLK